MICKRLAYPILLATTGVASPAFATGSMECSTAGANPITVSVGMGRGISASAFSPQLMVGGRAIAVAVGQVWSHGQEFRLLLVSPEHEREEVLISTRWNEETEAYDGSLWRGGQRRWVRCIAY